MRCTNYQHKGSWFGQSRVLDTIQITIIESEVVKGVRSCNDNNRRIWYCNLAVEQPVVGRDVTSWCAPVSCAVLLECTTVGGDIEVFEILRARVAPVSYTHGLLPSTVMKVISYAHRSSDRLHRKFARAMAMVRHLVDVVECDVNSISYGLYYGSGSICSTPLCGIACHTREGMKELVKFLLGHGGDLDPAGPLYDSVRVPNARTAAKKSRRN
jgi:hypothetical protein